MIGDIMQPTHLLFVLVIALLVLGPKRLPEVGRQLGKGLRDFRAAINGEHTDQHDEFGAERSQVHQAPPQPMEHQFAHQTTESVASYDQPATGMASGSAANGHEFAHEAPVEVPHADGGATDRSAGPGASEQRSDASGSDQPTDAADTPTHQVDAGASGTAGEHQFAYEPPRPAEKPVDPLS
jgi:TatA/E family protein of Tat protein translocase